ncbi:hypothetical protein C0995_005104 [Termitomyces sp. Mi166|nr:hypothetical protein C0995_005104 [Termitomyces sp. Mi166\
MNQTRADFWSLEVTPTITSFFELCLIDGHSPMIDTAPVTTGKCGLGWYFIFQATNEDIKQPMWSSKETAKRTQFRISLATQYPALTTSLDKFPIAIETDENTILETTIHASEISLSSSDAIPLVSILSVANFTGDIAIKIRVELPTAFELVGDPSEGSEQKLRRSLAQSLSGIELGDVKFALFNRRRRGKGNVVTTSDPQIIFANLSLLQGRTTSLDVLLSGTDAERRLVTSAQLTDLIYNTYDYMSEDSDLESDIDQDAKDSDDLGSEVSSTRSEQEPSSRKLSDNEQAILIDDIASSTWKVLMFYLYTGEIHFKLLKSRTLSCDAKLNGHEVSCSPKSMYRLATKFGHEELRKLSLEAIIRDLKEDNIVEELFSYFASMYPEVQKAEFEALTPLLKEPSVAEKLSDRMKSASTQDLPHCAATVAAIADHLVELAITERPQVCPACSLTLASENEDQGLSDENDDDDNDNGKNMNKNKKHKDDGKDGKDEKLSEGDKGKLKPGESSEKSKSKSTKPSYRNESLEISKTKDTQDSSDGFTAVGWRKTKRNRFDLFLENGGFEQYQ